MIRTQHFISRGLYHWAGGESAQRCKDGPRDAARVCELRMETFVLRQDKDQSK